MCEHFTMKHERFSFSVQEPKIPFKKTHYKKVIDEQIFLKKFYNFYIFYQQLKIDKIQL